MVEIKKCVEKAYCCSCNKRSDDLYNIEIMHEVSGGSHGTEICGICKECLMELKMKIEGILQ